MESIRNLHIVLLIGVMSVVQMAKICPYSDPSGNIISLSSNSLPSGLRSISLYDHPLTNISEEAFDTSAATLQSAVFLDVNFTSLPTALKKLTSLTSLNIENTRIQDWDNATLKQIATTLEELLLKDVGLFTWPSWIVNFPLLRALDLSSNSLYSIPDDALNSCKDSLEFLDLSGTRLTHVPQALSTLSSLLTLHLGNNNFTDVSEIEKLTQLPFAQRLSSLFLDSVGLSRVANFSNFTNLRKITLSGNRISDVPAGLLHTSLTRVNLNDNHLSSVPAVIATLFKLSALYIENNYITEIEPNSFPSNLTHLMMGANRVAVITNTTFRNLNLLQSLTLNYNPITIIFPEAFSTLGSLQYLYMKESQLIEIPLAFVPLNFRVQIWFSTTQPLTCPCPVPPRLVQWFTSLQYYHAFDTTCSNGQSVISYLNATICSPLLNRSIRLDSFGN